jgi:predicted O-methyltransferase YrrM
VLHDPRTAEANADIVEFGCWEGRSTIALAIAAFPATVTAVDTWQGNSDEDPNHPTVCIAAQRDVQSIFRRNIAALTDGNVVIVQEDCHRFLEQRQQPIRFAHIDASHDYDSVARTIGAVSKLIVPGGVICGHDILTASANRDDLQGGVERAVVERLPGFQSEGNFWFWQAP